MSGPATSCALYLWLQLRWVLAGILAYLFVLAVGAQLYPGFEPVLLATLLLTAAVGHLLQAFTLGPADIGVRRSNFPHHMFVLPAATRSLVGWYMLYGAATNALLWILVASFVLIPAGFDAPVLWPAVLCAAATAWVQAIGWTPFPTPFARIPVLALGISPLLLMGLWAGLFLESRVVSAVVIAGGCLWAVAAFAFGLRGLTRARCGDESDWIAPLVKACANFFRAGRRARVRRPFRTGTAAQFWHECRRNAILLPIVLSYIGLPMLVFNCIAISNPDSSRTLMFGSITVTPAEMALLGWIFIPLILSISLGPGMGRMDVWGKDELPTFFAVRPMSTSRFVAIKLAAAALSVAAAWCVVLVFLAMWAAIEASPLNQEPSIVRAAWRRMTPRAAVIGALMFAALVLLAWRGVVNGMWPSLTGRKWLSSTLAIASLVGLSLAGVGGMWIYKHPEIQTGLSSAAVWMLGALVALKLGLAAGALVALEKRCLVSRYSLVMLMTAWIVVAAAMIAGLSYWTPFTWTLAAGVVLFLPLTRVAFAPLALSWNRHQ